MMMVMMMTTAEENLLFLIDVPFDHRDKKKQLIDRLIVKGRVVLRVLVVRISCTLLVFVTILIHSALLICIDLYCLSIYFFTLLYNLCIC